MMFFFFVKDIRSLLFKLVHKRYIIQKTEPKFLFILWNIPTIIIDPDDVFMHHMQVKSKGKAIFVTGHEGP
jgi:hypothetical protein